MVQLKQFLKLRDTRPEFDEIKAAGRVGLPCIVINGGEQILFELPENLDELKDAFVELHKESIKIAANFDKQKKLNDRLKQQTDDLKKKIESLSKIEHVPLPCISCEKLKY